MSIIEAKIVDIPLKGCTCGNDTHYFQRCGRGWVQLAPGLEGDNGNISGPDCDGELPFPQHWFVLFYDVEFYSVDVDYSSDDDE